MSRGRGARWIHSPGVDAAVAFAWVPFVVAAHAYESDAHRVSLVLTATFLLSFAHQPLTLPIVYGDPAERAAHRRLYAWCPVAFVVAVVVGMHLSLAAVAVVAGLWNAEHTLMQRFGITRIYGRKAGEVDAADGRREKAMLVSWLVLAIVVAAASSATARRILHLPLGRVNRQGLHLLVDLQPLGRLLLPVALGAAAVSTLRVVAVERGRLRAGTANPAKHLYLMATAALVGVMLGDPVAGFVGYVGAHAVEYFVIVHRSLPNRWADDGAGGAVGALVRRPGGIGRLLGLYAVAIVALTAGLLVVDGGRLYLSAILVLGGLHVLYDGFIWKLRRPAVARGLVTAAAV